MATDIKTNWMKDFNGDLFAPKTLVESIQNKEGKTLQELLDEGGSGSVENITLIKKEEYDYTKHEKDMIYFVSTHNTNLYFIKDGKILAPEENYLYTKDSGNGELEQEVIGEDLNKYTTINWNGSYSNNGTALIYKLRAPIQYNKVTFNIGADTVGNFTIFYGEDSSFWNTINNNNNNVHQTHNTGDVTQYIISLENLPSAAIIYVGIGVCTGCKLYIKDIIFEK